jgi:hypothetical protein
LGATRTRGDFLKIAAGGALLALGVLSGCEADPRIRATASPARAGQTWAFRSRPDLKPPPVEVIRSAGGTAPGYVFAAAKNGPGEEHVAQDGPMILDNEGLPVWLRPVRDQTEDAMDFKAQRYKGESVLTWWQGVHGGWGQGEYLIFDASYREVARVRAGNGYDGDHHEFLISERNTALFTIYHGVPMDLSPFGGPKDGTVMDGIAQEVDIETGEVLFEWHSLEHVGFEESTSAPVPDLEDAYDYFHINSVEFDHDGNLLVGSRKTSTIYKISRGTGEVIWRLGGERSDFAMGEGARFAFQHDARRLADGTISLFDNRGLDAGELSRGVVLELDEGSMEATLVREYTHPDRPFTPYQASVQHLPNGNAFVGWGNAPYLTEHGPNGELLFDARFPREVESYRAFRFPWEGWPKDRPAVAAEAGPEDRVTLYASWNGATGVDAWEVMAGPETDRLEPLGSVSRKGFETAIALTTDEPFVAVRATDRAGRVMGISRVVRRGG